MALSDLSVFEETVYRMMGETVAQDIEKFNAASGGAITLDANAFMGDYKTSAMWKKISGVVRRRNVYGSGSVAEKKLEHLEDVAVKIAAGTPPIRIDKSWMTWIQQNPEAQGVEVGRQLAPDMMQDMLNAALGTGVAAMQGESEIVYDATGNSSPDDELTLKNFNTGQALFGDRVSDLAVWIMHSKPLFDLYEQNIANSQQLFVYGNLNIRRDPFGRLIIITDSPNLLLSGSPNNYWIMGLVTNAIEVSTNNDYDSNILTTNGDENLNTTFQAEWTYNVGVKGFAWDKTNGGKCPTDAALFTSSNWDRYATSHKDLAGVLLKVK